MNCACRTKSLRIFVQSLTEVRVADSAVRFSASFPRTNTKFLAFRQTPVSHHIRSFASTSSAHSSGEPKWDEDPDNTFSSNNEWDSFALNAETKPSSGAGTPAAIPAVSQNDIALAKINGTILDISPESIDSLISELDRSTLTGGDVASSAEYDDDASDARSTNSSRTKPPVTQSRLKRLKIMKSDGGRAPTERQLKAAKIEDWKIQKIALKEKFPEGWRPRKRLSPDALDGIRALHAQFPEHYTTKVLSNTFEVSPEAIRRILRTHWKPSPEEEEGRHERWFRRGLGIWSQMAEMGTKPPRKWREEGVVRAPHWNAKTGPRTEYPYVPRHKEQLPERQSGGGGGPKESLQRKASSSLL